MRTPYPLPSSVRGGAGSLDPSSRLDVQSRLERPGRRALVFVQRRFTTVGGRLDPYRDGLAVGEPKAEHRVQRAQEFKLLHRTLGHRNQPCPRIPARTVRADFEVHFGRAESRCRVRPPVQPRPIRTALHPCSLWRPRGRVKAATSFTQRRRSPDGANGLRCVGGVRYHSNMSSKVEMTIGPATTSASVSKSGPVSESGPVSKSGPASRSGPVGASGKAAAPAGQELVNGDARASDVSDVAVIGRLDAAVEALDAVDLAAWSDALLQGRLDDVSLVLCRVDAQVARLAEAVRARGFAIVEADPPRTRRAGRERGLAIVDTDLPLAS